MKKDINWSNLGFGYFKTKYNVRTYWKNGEWGELEISSEETINIHIAASCLHYGQEAFEGLKVFKGKDGKARVFRWEENAKRLRSSADGIMMAKVPDELFKKALDTVVKLNKEYIPPYESGASLYVRPLLIGTGPRVGVKPADEYLFLMFVGPVGPYFKEGFKPVQIQLARDADRAAPLGTGNIKVGGNYAASLKSGERAHKEGFSSVLYVDAKEKKYIDECGPANFFAIKDNTYITPKSTSILPSITNKSLITIAEDMGMKTERRPIAIEELSTFDEAGACGTAAVISPIGRILDRDNNKEYIYCKDNNAGPISTKLYNKLRAIQYGDEPDKFNWVTILDV
ncbi:MAG: branched-chain amino acid aminotransferase [Bacteroidales bacterium]|nr:branched-chain amino acid aminotransferase [Bacteroidales bacterium]